MKLVAQLCRVADVTPEQCEQMFALMKQHFEGVQRSTFEADLNEKQWVIQVFDPQTDSFCGFSTQMLLDVAAAGRPIKALFSGDTIMHRQHWGDNALARVWGRLALSLMETHPDGELYWFLISKGYKTYRFLPLFFQEYYPRPTCATPVWAKEVIDALGQFKYPADYDPATGVVRADSSRDRLRPGIADITPVRLRDPHVRFFSERNPGHVLGEELCCLAPLTRANFTPAAYRVIGPEPVLLGVG